MKVLATVSDMRRVAIIIDFDSQQVAEIEARPDFLDPTITGQAPFRPFGISWSPEWLYIVSHHQVLIFDRNLRFVAIRSIRLPGNTHQLIHYDGRLWVVSPWTNSLIGISQDDHAIEVDLLSQTIVEYCERVGDEEDDRCHFNSLLFSDESIFVAAHGFGPKSFIFRLELDDFRLSEILNDVGSSIHGLAKIDGDLYWLSTDTREIRSRLGYRHLLSRSGYARGFAATAGHFVVAISERLARGERHTGDSWLQVIDRVSGEVVEEVRLPGAGSVNDLRVLDEFDYGHQVNPIWSPSFTWRLNFNRRDASFAEAASRSRQED